MSEEDVEEFSKMFPGLDKQVIKVIKYFSLADEEKAFVGLW